MNNNLTGLVLVGTTNATLKPNSQYLTGVPDIVADIFDISRSIATLVSKTYYIVVNYDINSKVSLVDSSDVDGVDDAWTLEKIDVTLASDHGSTENESGTSQLYNPSRVTFNLPTNEKYISLAKLSIDVAENSQVIKNINNVELDISCLVGVTSDGRFSLSKNNINFVGEDASYELHEDLGKHQLAAYKVDGSNNTSQFPGSRDDINVDKPDILTAKLSTNSNLGLPNVNQNLLKTWYSTTLDNLVEHVDQVKILDTVDVTINAIDASTNHVLSQWARSKLQNLDNSGNQTWEDNENDNSPRTLDNPFAEGDYVICNTSFDYQPRVNNSMGEEEDLVEPLDSTYSGVPVYVVLKQVTPSI